jgi:hypothetical protein
MKSSRRGAVDLCVDEGHVETGLWCPRCLKPSGWRAPLVLLSEKGVTLIGTISRCLDGDHPLRLPGDLA